MSDPHIRDRSHTKQAILKAALRVLARTGELTAIGVADEAEYTDRTVFRHFPTRKSLVVASAKLLNATLQLPENPATLEDLLSFSGALFSVFEQHRALLRAACESNVREHFVKLECARRRNAIAELLKGQAPRAAEQQRELVGITLTCHLSAHGWHYYRFVQRCTQQQSVAAAQSVVQQQLKLLEKNG